MSDSEDSIVTYITVSNPFEGLSDIGSQRVDGPPMMPEDPYAYVLAAFHVPPSLDYVPGPEEPQAPLPPDFILKPVYLEFMPPEDEEDPTDYPADRDDDDEEEEEPFGDDAEDEEDDEEEEHPDPADSISPPPMHRVTARMSVRPQTLAPFLSEEDTERFLVIPTPPPSPLTPLSSPLPKIPSPPLLVSPPLPLAPSLLPTSPT
ncbi:hypothetical protein Tco_1257079 [Tanacetum coccineum]